MKLQDMGINPKDNAHNGRLTGFESAFVSTMWDHCGHANRIPAAALAVRFYRRRMGYPVTPDEAAHIVKRYNESPVMQAQLDEWKRDVRRLHNHLVMSHEHLPIMSKAGRFGGYWLAETEDEAEAFFYSFRKRGMTGLVKASRGKKAAMTEIVEQLTFDFEELTDATGTIVSGPDTRGTSAPVAVVDAFLKRMLENPDRYAAGLRMIGKKYGGVLLPRRQIDAMREKAAELSRLVAEIM